MKTVVISRLFFTVFLFYISLSTTEAQNISGVINSYHRVTAINTGTNTLTLNSAAGLAVGTRVLMIQMKGATIDNTNSESFGNVNSINNAGNYEFNHICGIAGNDVLLARPIIRSYTTAGIVQLVTVPLYNIVTVTGTLTASTWNPATGTGGVLVFEADTINLNSNIDVSGQGFAGGGIVDYPLPLHSCHTLAPVNDYYLPLMPPGTSASPQMVSAAPKGEGVAAFITNAEYAMGKQANGGGGANNHNAGGGGGSNYGSGGIGGMRSLEGAFHCHGPNPGRGGFPLSALGYTPGNNRIFLGGGGGAGHQNNSVGTPGANGGGIAIVTANVIVSSGISILADGARPFRTGLLDPLQAGGDGGGGGGGGGTVILDVSTVNGSINASAVGGRGSNAARNGSDCPGSGGGGGGGVIWMRGGSPIANVTSNVIGGNSGTGSPSSPTIACRNTTAGAAAGTNGAVLTGYVRPMGATPACAPLPVRELKSFTGRATENGNLLQWQMLQVDNIVRFEIERTIDQVNYTTIATKNNEGSLSYSVTDGEKFLGTVYYRLRVIRSNNQIDYSHFVRIDMQQSSSFQWLSMQPNPATQQVTISVASRQTTIVNITLFNGPSQPVLKQQARVSAGFGKVLIPLHQLSKGVYWMVVEADGTRTVKPLVKD